MQKTKIFLVFLMCFGFISNSFAASRIKDLITVEGIRDNVLIGYGLVVGLDGTGDDIKSLAFTEQSLIGMLERLGINTKNEQVDPDNIAAVMVTATLPAFARNGTKIDVTVSAMGDSDSLEGGTLLITPLIGADGEVYAVAQGTVTSVGTGISGNAATLIQNIPTNGKILNGGIIEKETGFDLNAMTSLKLFLNNPDFTTAKRISDAINVNLGHTICDVEDSATINMIIPEAYEGKVSSLLTKIESLYVQPDFPAKIVIDESSGTIVIGEQVKVSKVAIAQGNLTIRVTESFDVSQPLPFAEAGETVVVPETEIEVIENDNVELTVMNGGVTLQELVEGLNALGVGPRDLILILHAVKAAGAIQAQVEVM